LWLCLREHVTGELPSHRHFRLNVLRVNRLGLCGRACAIERGGLEPSNRCRIAVVVAEARLAISLTS
jgi:hypothetical protein